MELIIRRDGYQIRLSSADIITLIKTQQLPPYSKEEVTALLCYMRTRAGYGEGLYPPIVYQVVRRAH